MGRDDENLSIKFMDILALRKGKSEKEIDKTNEILKFLRKKLKSNL